MELGSYCAVRAFSIKNFKGIKNVDIDLSNNRILTLIGLNESGKTTILEAIQLFYELTRNSAEPSKEKLNAYRPKGTDFTGTIAIEAELEFEDSDYEKIQALWEKEWHRSERLVLPQTFSYCYKFECELHEYTTRCPRSAWFDVLVDDGESESSLYDVDNSSWQALVNYIKKDLMPEIILYEDFIFDIPEKITYNCSTSSTNDTKNQEWQLVLDDIVRSVNNQFSFQAHVVDIWFSDNNTAENRIAQMEEVLNAKITTAWKALFQKNNKKVHFKEIKIGVEPVHGNGIAIAFKVKTDDG